MGRAVVAFAGKRGSGKSTAADILVKERGFVDVKFAGPLKAMLTQLYRDHGFGKKEIIRRLEGDLKEEPCEVIAYFDPSARKSRKKLYRMVSALFQHVRGKPIRIVTERQGWAANHSAYMLIGKLAKYWKPGETPRTAMQQLGTEWRDTIDTELWSRIFAYVVTRGLYRLDSVVCSDYRFPHEANALAHAKAVIYKIQRPSLQLDELSLHPSEALTDVIPYDIEITNDGTVEDLQRQVLLSVDHGMKWKECTKKAYQFERRT